MRLVTAYVASLSPVAHIYYAEFVVATRFDKNREEKWEVCSCVYGKSLFEAKFHPPTRVLYYTLAKAEQGNV